MKVNGKTIRGIGFAYNGCHKFYILANMNEWKTAKEYGFQCHSLRSLQRLWNASCPLRFISTWNLSDYYVEQGEQAVFEPTLKQ